MRFTLIDDGTATVTDATVTGERVALSPATVRDVLGWTLESQGLCHGDVCIPVRRRDDLVGPHGIDLATLADLLGRPLALEAAAGAACLGASAQDRGSRLASLEAPDFALPDLEGRRHALSDYRGRKVLLVAYASW